MANTHFSIRPRKKIGMLMPMSDTIVPPVDPRAAPLRGHHAQRDAEGEREGHRRDRELDRRREALKEVVGDVAAGDEAAAEVEPSRPDRYSQYCSKSGWSRPSASRTRARLSGVARSPRIALAGSPGRSRMKRKITTVSPSRIGSRSRNRRRMNLPTSPSRVAYERGPRLAPRPSQSSPGQPRLLAAQPHRVEALRTGRVGLVALDLLVKARAVSPWTSVTKQTLPWMSPATSAQASPRAVWSSSALAV